MCVLRLMRYSFTPKVIRSNLFLFLLILDRYCIKCWIQMSFKNCKTTKFVLCVYVYVQLVLFRLFGKIIWTDWVLCCIEELLILYSYCCCVFDLYVHNTTIVYFFIIKFCIVCLTKRLILSILWKNIKETYSVSHFLFMKIKLLNVVLWLSRLNYLEVEQEE